LSMYISGKFCANPRKFFLIFKTIGGTPWFFEKNQKKIFFTFYRKYTKFIVIAYSCRIYRWIF
jgi:hypothetical protein